MGLFTIGHSTLTLDDFFLLLDRHGVDLLFDVRSSPYSAPEEWRDLDGGDVIEYWCRSDYAAWARR